MQDITYLIGVLCAIGSGILNNLGTVVQKKVVNELPEGEKIGRNLLKSPMWLFGLVLQFALGTVLFLIAIDIIGVALTPGLMAAGLIFLAIGSVKILGEHLKKQEVIGIILMVVAITILGFSELETTITPIELSNTNFIVRTTVFTLILWGLAIFCELYQRRRAKYRGISYAVYSGSMLAMTNFWVAPLMGTIGLVFGGQFIVWFVLACVILVITNYLAIFKLQQAFQHGQAANLIPIQQVPIQIGPVFVFFYIFMGIPPYHYSLPFMIIAVAMIIVSSFLLGQRQAKLEEIK